MTPPLLSEGQALALEQLHELIRASRGAIELPLGDPELADNGYLVARVSIDCAGTPHTPAGIRLRPRERFLIHVPPGFPHTIPVVNVPHPRWAGTPHVQWSSHLCLYATPSIEWAPADGLVGLFDRLRLWLESASLGELDPDDAPLHPPVAYPTAGTGVVVVRADLGAFAPEVGDGGRRSLRHQAHDRPSGRATFVVGVMEVVRNGRLDLVGWMSLEEWHLAVADRTLVERRADCPVVGALAILTDREIAFEYPTSTQAIVDALAGYEVSPTELFGALGDVALDNHTLARRRAPSGSEIGTPDLHLFLGTPSRRTAEGKFRQHLVCWRLDRDGEILSSGAALADSQFDEDGAVAEAVARLLPQWIRFAAISWVTVMEDRAEVTVRRDHGTSAAWLAGQRVLLLGCGALGGPIAESCVHAGASEVVVCDNDVVTPGVLVRQPFADADIGTPKAHALAARLDAINTGTTVSAEVGEAQHTVIPVEATPRFNLVIDATADASLRSVVELRRWRSDRQWPPMLTVMIGHDARRGVVAVSDGIASGASHDVLRKFALATRTELSGQLKDVADDLFPLEPRNDLFHPEPGCSSPTFVGSAMQLGSLAGALLDAGIDLLRSDAARRPPMGAIAVRGVDATSRLPRSTTITWENDLAVRDDTSGYEVRITRSALSEMRAEVRRGARLRGGKVETGGPLFGQIDDACRCVWIDQVGGPPPDSVLSEYHFDHGTEGVDELVRYHRDRSGSQTTFVGMWHSHPFQSPKPSPTDEAAMSAMVMPVADGPRRAVVLIVGGPRDAWTRWVEGDDDPDVFARLTTRDAHTTAIPAAAPPAPPEHHAAGWSGGWGTQRERSRPECRRRRLRVRLPWRERLRRGR